MIDQMAIERNDAPAIISLNNLLVHALQSSASDVHLESELASLIVRFRIDGLLMIHTALEKEIGLQIISRIKVLAALNVAERRIPQDGTFTIAIAENTYDVRVATFPSLYGEKTVLRLLQRESSHRLVHHLGLSRHMYDLFMSLIHAANGFFLVTGPTGSGKTTTLHAILASIATAEKNCMTLEDPVEYALQGITQTAIHPELGFTFEKGLRSLLRLDPDIIMVGEIRDRETAHVALQAALTGHFVVSSLHTADAPSALIRLQDMGIEPFLINAGVTAILAQRLVRKLCSICRYEVAPNDAEEACMQKLGVDLPLLFKSRGCEACLQGYKGRIGIFQLLIMSHSLRRLIMEKSDYEGICAQATVEGMQSLIADGADKLAAGVTSLSELIRVLV